MVRLCQAIRWRRVGLRGMQLPARRGGHSECRESAEALLNKHGSSQAPHVDTDSAKFKWIRSVKAISNVFQMPLFRPCSFDCAFEISLNLLKQASKKTRGCDTKKSETLISAAVKKSRAVFWTT